MGEVVRIHKYIDCFHPVVERYNSSRRDVLRLFDAGEDNFSFNEFINAEAAEYAEAGEGVTYLVWNKLYHEQKETGRELIGYFTLASNAIPFEDRIRLDEEEAILNKKEFDVKLCGVSALQIKMFTIDKKYQDLFYKTNDLDMPIAAWIMRLIIDYANEMIQNVLGFKVIFLYSVPDAENFYKMNGFSPLAENMMDFHCVDSEFTPMYLTLRQFVMHNDT